MIGAWMPAILAAVCWPQGTAKAERFSPPAHQTDWLRTYDAVPFKEIWSLALSVVDTDKAVALALKAADWYGAALTGPFGSFPSSRIDQSQQLSFAVPAARGGDLVKSLRTLGHAEEPVVRPAGEAAALSEIQEKIERLAADKKAHDKQLATMPAISQLVDAELEHLLMIEGVERKAQTQILLNVSISQRADQ